MNKSDAKDRLDALEAIFAALAHPARRQILLVVNFRGGEMSAGEIAERFSCAWPTTTRHLGVLVEAGLLSYEKRGRARVYRIDRSRLDMVKEWLGWFESGEADGDDGKQSGSGGGGTARVRARPARRE